MSGASLETTLELWSADAAAASSSASARCLPRRVLWPRPRLSWTGCSGPERRKTGWMRAEAAGDPGPWRQQAVLGRSHWDADALRDVVRDYALETLAEAATRCWSSTRPAF